MNRFVVTRIAPRCWRAVTAKTPPPNEQGRLLQHLSLSRRFSTQALDEDDDDNNKKDQPSVKLDQYKMSDSSSTDNVSNKLNFDGFFKKPESSATTTANAACADDDEEDDDEMEQEDMFVEPHESFEFRTMEWGGPRRGGRFPEPTRYGDWERKGRCTDF